MTIDPTIYLAIDNCFASKRWTEPHEWCGIAHDLGIHHIEASADNECDPLYTSATYLEDWIAAIQSAGTQTGVSVSNLYSGHGTYATLGLTHPDHRIRDRIQHDWLETVIDNAAKLKAGVGFFCHGFKQSVLQNELEYTQAMHDLEHRLGELAQYAQAREITAIGLEQMYTPHQIPWTIKGTLNLIRAVYTRSGGALYTTIDTGHQCAQNLFKRPSSNELEDYITRYRNTGSMKGIWLGANTAYDLLRENTKQNTNTIAARIEDEMNRLPHLFAEPVDADLYAWLKELACYSPIIHLQQTNGTSSSHLPFTASTEKFGIVNGEKVLRAIAESYLTPESKGMPPRSNEIFLTLELFSGTKALPEDIIEDMTASVNYWRRYIPKDGLRLSELLNQLNSSQKKP